MHACACCLLLRLMVRHGKMFNLDVEVRNNDLHSELHCCVVDLSSARWQEVLLGR